MFPLKDEQKRPADHILQLAIHLPPVPGLTNQEGDNRATLGKVVDDDFLNKDDVVLGDGTIPIRHDCGHAVCLTETPCERTDFFWKKRPVNDYDFSMNKTPD